MVNRINFNFKKKKALIFSCESCGLRYSDQSTLMTHKQNYCSKRRNVQSRSSSSSSSDDDDESSSSASSSSDDIHSSRSPNNSPSPLPTSDRSSKSDPNQTPLPNYTKYVMNQNNSNVNSNTSNNDNINNNKLVKMIKSITYQCNSCLFETDKKSIMNRHSRVHLPQKRKAMEELCDTPKLNEVNPDITRPPAVTPSTSPTTDKSKSYCKDCDIQFSSITTYQHHRNNYCQKYKTIESFIPLDSSGHLAQIVNETTINKPKQEINLKRPLSEDDIESLNKNSIEDKVVSNDKISFNYLIPTRDLMIKHSIPQMNQISSYQKMIPVEVNNNGSVSNSSNPPPGAVQFGDLVYLPVYKVTNQSKPNLAPHFQPLISKSPSSSPSPRPQAQKILPSCNPIFSSSKVFNPYKKICIDENENAHEKLPSPSYSLKYSEINVNDQSGENDQVLDLSIKSSNENKNALKSEPIPKLDKSLKKFQCDTCELSFGTSEVLRAHKLTGCGSENPKPIEIQQPISFPLSSIQVKQFNNRTTPMPEEMVNIENTSFYSKFKNPVFDENLKVSATFGFPISKLLQVNHYNNNNNNNNNNQAPIVSGGTVLQSAFQLRTPTIIHQTPIISPVSLPSQIQQPPQANKIYHCTNCQQIFFKFKAYKRHECDRVNLSDSGEKLSKSLFQNIDSLPKSEPAEISRNLAQTGPTLISKIDEELLRHPLVRKTMLEIYGDLENKSARNEVAKNFFICTTCGYRGNTCRGVKQHGKLHFSNHEHFAIINMTEKEPILVYHSLNDCELSTAQFSSESSSSGLKRQLDNTNLSGSSLSRNKKLKLDEQETMEEIEDELQQNKEVNDSNTILTETPILDVPTRNAEIFIPNGQPLPKKARLLDSHYQQQQLLHQQQQQQINLLLLQENQNNKSINKNDIEAKKPAEKIPTSLNNTNTNNNSNSSVDKSQTYCFKCNIQFKQFSNFLAHKKLYCK